MTIPQDGNLTGAERLLRLLKFVDFTFPGQVSHVRVYDYKMCVQILGVSGGMVNLMADKHLFPGMYIKTHGTVVYIYAHLSELNNGLCGYLDVRRCWGLTKIEHWIAELELFRHVLLNLRGKSAHPTETYP